MRRIQTTIYLLLAGTVLSLVTVMAGTEAVYAITQEADAVSYAADSSAEVEIPDEATTATLKRLANSLWQRTKNAEYANDWSNWDVGGEIYADSMDADGKGFVLFFAVYFQQDARVQLVDQETIAVTKADLHAMMEELFGSVSGEVMEYFYSTFPMSVDGELCYFAGTGGFGAANGPIGMKDPDQVTAENGILTLQGDMYPTNQLPDDAESIGRYTVTYRKTDGDVLGGFVPESIITVVPGLEDSEALSEVPAEEALAPAPDSGVLPENVTEDGVNWKAAYTEFITTQAFLSEQDYEPADVYEGYLYDMDQDGIPELIISNGYTGSDPDRPGVFRRGYVFTYADGNVQYIGDGPDAAYYDPAADDAALYLGGHGANVYAWIKEGLSLTSYDTGSPAISEWFVAVDLKDLNALIPDIQGWDNTPDGDQGQTGSLSDASLLFSQIAGHYVLPAGNSYGRAEMNISDDGQISGIEDYMEGNTWKSCEYSARLTDVIELDEYSYSAKVSDYTLSFPEGTTEGNKEYFDAGYADAEFVFYLPGHDVSTLPEDVVYRLETRYSFQLGENIPDSLAEVWLTNGRYYDAFFKTDGAY